MAKLIPSKTKSVKQSVNQKTEDYLFVYPNIFLKKQWRDYPLNPWKFYKSKTFINIIIAERGHIAKTTNFMRLAKDLFYHDRDSRFIWVRRIKEELKLLKGLFESTWNILGVTNMKRFKFSEKGVFYNMESSARKKPDWRQFIEFVDLNAIDKSRFVNFQPENVKFVFWDEFLTVSNRYIKDEINKLFDLLWTKLRSNNQAKLIMTANNISDVSIYHMLFKIPKAGLTNKIQKIYVKPKNKNDEGFFITFWAPKAGTVGNNKKIGSVEKISRALGINEYAFSDNPIYTNKTIIKKIPISYKFKINIICEEIKLGIFEHYKTKQLIITEKFNPTGITKVFNLNDAGRGTFWDEESRKWIIRAFINEKRQMQFSNEFVRNIFLETLKNFQTYDKWYN